MSHLQDTWIKWNDLSQILMSLLKLKLRPLYDITINLSEAGSTAVTQAQIVHFPIHSPLGYGHRELRDCLSDRGDSALEPAPALRQETHHNIVCQMICGVLGV